MTAAARVKINMRARLLDRRGCGSTVFNRNFVSASLRESARAGKFFDVTDWQESVSHTATRMNKMFVNLQFGFETSLTSRAANK